MEAINVENTGIVVKKSIRNKEIPKALTLKITDSSIESTIEHYRIVL